MARSVKKYLKISKGQISKNLAERTDIGILDDSGQEITNFYDTKYGALQTVAGTEFMFNFGKDAKVKLHTIHLSDNKEATLAFDATNQKLYLFDYQGNQLDQISFPYITESNYERSNIAQQEELILLATGDNPLVRIGITNNKLTHSIYTIPAKNVMKVTNVIRPSQKINVYRTKLVINNETEANEQLPTIDTNWPIGTYVQPNQTEDAPSLIFPWSVYKKTDSGWVGPIDYTPKQSELNLLYTQTTPGEGNFTIPDEYNYATIEFAGGNGSPGATLYKSEWLPAGNGGAGEKSFITNLPINNRTITFVIGSNGSIPGIGGNGYNVGGNGTQTTQGGSNGWGGGGGGSTGVTIDDVVYEASGGGGATLNDHLDGKWYHAKGGKGAGPKGGAFGLVQNTEGVTNGGNATGQYINDTDGAYIKISASVTDITDTTAKIENDWSNQTFEYINESWVNISNNIDLNYPKNKFAVSATAGIVNITPASGNLFSVEAPAVLDVKTYAESLLLGTNFDSESAIGVVRITAIEGTVSGRSFNVTKLSGPTIVGFDKVYTTGSPAIGFNITVSMTPALSGALPNTNDNPTSDTNYPNLITFYQQRLVIFGTQYNQEQVLFSNIGEYDNFTDEYLSTSAFQLVIGSDQKESIRAFCLNQGIQIFTNVSEWLMDSQTITRTTGFVRNSQMGTNGVKPIISANGTTLFCPKNGKGIIGFIYNEQSASYMTPYISMFTDLLDVEIRDLFLKRGRDSQDDTLLYICDANGNLIIGNYLQDHNIQGFCRRSATGVKFLQSVQNEENVLLLSSRAGYTTLERIDQTKKTAHSTRLFQYNQNTGVITLELPQYQNTLLNVYDENGEFVDAYTCENNQIKIPSKPQGISEIGYNIHQVFHSNPMNIGGITMSEYKSIARIDIALTSESRHDALTINKKYGRRKGNLVSYVRPQRPTRDCTFTIENDIYPVEILSMEVEIEY